MTDFSAHIKLAPLAPSVLEQIAVIDTMDLSTPGRERYSHLITRINVPRDYRGKGYGRLLMQTLCRKADEFGITLFIEAIPYADCSMTQAELSAWYERCGFSMFGGILRRLPAKR